MGVLLSAARSHPADTPEVRDLADIYFGEFMRLHVHYAYRESLHFRRPSGEVDDYGSHRKYLVESSEWIEGEKPGQGYFDKRSPRAIRRTFFAGS